MANKQSISDILNTDIEKLVKMDRRELAKNVSILASAANKRLRRLEKAGETDAFAYSKIMERHGDFSVKGKDLNELRKEFIQVKGFLNNVTSTVKGWRTFLKETSKRIDPSGDWKGFANKETRKQYWRMYNKAMERHPSLRNNSLRVQLIVREIYQEFPLTSEDELDKIIEERLRKEYIDLDKQEKTQEEQSDDFYNVWRNVDYDDEEDEEED